MNKISEYLTIKSPSAAFTDMGNKPSPRWHHVLDSILYGTEALFWDVVQALPVVLLLFCQALLVSALFSPLETP